MSEPETRPAIADPREPEITIQETGSSPAPSEPGETPENGCEPESPEGDSSQDSLVDKVESEEPPPQSSESNDESGTPKTSRELKSILALSKEAKLDTNITQRRKTLDKVKGTPQAPAPAKMTSFPVTAESELEIFNAKKRSGAEGATGKEETRGQQTAVIKDIELFAGDFVMLKKPNKCLYCWRCHHSLIQVACETCPRTYHLKCLKQTITDREHWVCPECVAILKAENTQTRSKAMKGMSLEHLCSLLKFGVKRMIQCNGSEPFIHPVDEKQFPEYRNYVIHPMTLSMLEKNIKENAYGSTQAFEADAKWILHNSIIFNSYQSKLTTAAKTIVKICKQEMAEVENCPSCYLNANTKKNTWFVEVCPKPHLLVWAKLKGFPYWPAKVMSINSQGMADVRFFGAHDKAWVSVRDCYLYSVKDPNSGKQKRNDIIECVKELELYVDNLREIYGRVNFAPFKTLLEADSQLRQLQVFLPNFRGDGKRVKEVAERLSKSISEENLEESDSEKSEESSDDVDEEEEDDEDDGKNKSNGDKHRESMTRIDYRDGPTGSGPPIRTIVIRKRYSTDGVQENSTKLARKEPETPEKEEEKPQSPSKLRISDQLIKKLEDLKENEPETENDKKVEDEKEEKQVEQPEEINEKVEEAKSNVSNVSKPTDSPEKPPESEKETGKKRKHEEDSSQAKVDLFPPNKMVKLVPIENILQKKDLLPEAPPPAEPPPPEQSKEIRVVKDGNEQKTAEENKSAGEPVKIKNEIESDDDNNDVQYMEAKRQYLSALNISEKQKIPMKPKAHEIRTRSKTEEKKIKETPKADESAQCLPPKPASEPVKEIYIKSLSKMQTPKHKARKSFPTPNYQKKTIVARKIVPKAPGLEDELTIVNAATLQPTGNVMILPKLHYNKPAQRELGSPPVLTMLPRPGFDANGKRVPEGSQNYIPQNEEGGDKAGTSGGGGGIILNNLLTGQTTQPPVIDADAFNDGDLGTLKEMLPENVSKGVGEILCQPPPKLKPKPTGLLNSGAVEAGVPSTAGPVATRINSMAQKLGDYFRSLLVETIGDLGKSNNPEAAISSLKYEIEELNHKHSIELAEIRRNVSIVLKDIQKSVVEERERIINETKANCEMETMKRVEEAKSKQWCANCSKEAQFYCCWNTSYCDYPCQQKHWPKHMSKCTQTSGGGGQNQASSVTPVVRPSGQQLVLTPTSAPKFGTLFAKPQKVYLKRTNTTTFKPATGSHITLVESTPGNFELLGSGPIAVNGKILASTSVIEKIKSGNIVTVTAPSGPTNTQLTSSANQKVNPVVAKSTASCTDSEH